MSNKVKHFLYVVIPYLSIYIILFKVLFGVSGGDIFFRFLTKWILLVYVLCWIVYIYGKTKYVKLQVILGILIVLTFKFIADWILFL